LEAWMSKKKKMYLAGGLAMLLVLVVLISIIKSNERGILVQTSKVERKDLLTSKVTSSGELRAKSFVDLQSEVAGIITELYVHEGDAVKTISPIRSISRLSWTFATAKSK
jgi:HlyD family secretion protein